MPRLPEPFPCLLYLALFTLSCFHWRMLSTVCQVVLFIITAKLRLKHWDLLLHFPLSSGSLVCLTVVSSLSCQQLGQLMSTVSVLISSSSLHLQYILVITLIFTFPAHDYSLGYLKDTQQRCVVRQVCYSWMITSSPQMLLHHLLSCEAATRPNSGAA